MGAHHHPRHAAPEGPGIRRLTWAVIVPLGLLTLGAMVSLWPPDNVVPERPGSAQEAMATVLSLDPEPCPEVRRDDVNGCGTALVRIDDGADAGQKVEIDLPNGPGAPRLADGDDVVVISSQSPEGAVYAIVDHQRATGLWVLAVAFALAIVAFGRWRGLAALAGLAVTFAVLILFVVPAILAGSPPLLVAIVGSAAIMLTVLYLTHGLALSTTVAVIGTLASLTITGLLSSLSVAALNLTGITDDLSTSVGSTYAVNMEGLLLAGIVIGSLGVLDDVTVTQAATVGEVARANASYGFAQLYKAGSRVGRAHIASVINTIILAYAGSSLPLLILIVANSGSLGEVVTDQVVAQEIVRSAVATLGLIAAVPITTALAAATARRG